MHNIKLLQYLIRLLNNWYLDFYKANLFYTTQFCAYILYFHQILICGCQHFVNRNQNNTLLYVVK